MDMIFEHRNAENRAQTAVRMAFGTASESHKHFFIFIHHEGMDEPLAGIGNSACIDSLVPLLNRVSIFTGQDERTRTEN
jgi:hypothetical protein